MRDTLEFEVSLRKVAWQRFDAKTFIIEKIATGLKKVNTSFCVLCADDDFLIPDGLRKCLHFLSNNPGYISAHGRYINHEIRKDGQNVHRKFGWFPCMNGLFLLEGNTPLARFQLFFPDITMGILITLFMGPMICNIFGVWPKNMLMGGGYEEMFSACCLF